MPVESTLLLGLLFVIAAAAGWFAARHTGSARRGDRGPGISPGYYEGLNYLLNDQPDKALDTFLKLVELDSSTLETHFALGSLFRRRGEVDRAIRIHQNVIARPNLPRPHRNQALYALGEDYLAAGLFDRAEKLFLELANLDGHRTGAMTNLLRIYEQQRDWSQAIRVRRKLESLTPGKVENVVSHYYCELAEEAVKGRDLSLARHFLKKAESGQRANVRTGLMKADLAARSGDSAGAVKQLKAVALAHERYAAETLVRLWHCVANDTPGSYEQIVSSLLGRRPALANDVAYAAIVADVRRSPPVTQAIREFVAANPVLVDMLGCLDIRLDPADADAIDRLAAALGRLARETPRYACADCGYTADVLYWQCPGCKSWETCGPNTRLRFSALLAI